MQLEQAGSSSNVSYVEQPNVGAVYDLKSVSSFEGVNLSWEQNGSIDGYNVYLNGDKYDHLSRGNSTYQLFGIPGEMATFGVSQEIGGNESPIVNRTVFVWQRDFFGETKNAGDYGEKTLKIGDWSVLKRFTPPQGQAVYVSWVEPGEKVLMLEDMQSNEVTTYQYFDDPANGTQGKDDITRISISGPERNGSSLYWTQHYFDSAGNEVGSDFRNLDGSIFKGDGPKMDDAVAQRCTLLMFENRSKDYYAYDSGGRWINPDGSAFDPANGFDEGRYQNYMQRIVASATSVTLKDGSTWNVKYFTYGGGIVTDLGYGIPARFIETVNGDQIYSWHPNSMLGDWIANRYLQENPDFW